MATMFYYDDADLGLLDGRTVAVLGYGSQGHAHAKNLTDSGVEVVVGLPSASRSRQRAEEAGLEVLDPAAAAERSQLVAMLVPDTAQKQVYEEAVAPHLDDGDALLFAHGFNIHFGQITPPEPIDVFMVAPKGPGHLVRRTYVEGNGIPGLVAVHQDATGRARDVALAYARGIGCTKAGVIETTFAEETETDLFGEQAVLCGGVSELVKAGYETLVEAGYQSEVAYFECLHELKLIVDLMYQGGLNYMRHSVSDTAEYGDYSAGRRVIGPQVRAAMRELLDEIRNGAFAARWIEESRTGGEEFRRRRAEQVDHPMDRVGRELRSMMPFVQPREVVPGGART
jgi:ketol-acid reductoisomerase